MNFKIIKNLYKKEILDVLRDKKTVLMMLVVPLVLYPLIMIGSFQLMAGIVTSMSEQIYRIAIDFQEGKEELVERFANAEEDGYSFEIVFVDNPEELLRSEELDAFIRKDEDASKENFQIYYMSSVTNSSYATNQIEEVLTDYARSLTVNTLEQVGLNANEVLSPVEITYHDMSSNEESAGSLLGSILPFMLIMSLLMGTMYPAIDTTAGERERGTLETVLTLPVTNQELIFSKFLTVATIGIVSALLNIISMGGVGIYMYDMIMTINESDSKINMSQFLPAIIVCILCVFAFAVFISAISMCVCAFAKSYKEANNYITPLTLVVMFASFVGFVPNVELTRNMALVPVVNICLLIKNILVMKFDIQIIAIALISNIIYGVLAVILLGKIYNSESVLFGDGSTGVQIFEKRSNMKKGGVPTVGDACLVIGIAAVAFIYIGGSLELKLGFYGILCSQLLFVLIPLFAALYTKKNIGQTFRIKACGPKYFFGGILMIMGALFAGMVLTLVVGNLFPSSAETVGESMGNLLGDNFASTLLVVAITPAICEELLFRGYIFSSLEAKLKARNAILAVAIIFGIYHMSIVRFFTTALLGGVICYVAYQSKSIFPGMLMHFLNNTLSCVVMYYPSAIGKIFPIFIKETYRVSDVCLLLGAGLVLLVLGCLIINGKRKQLEKE